MSDLAHIPIFYSIKKSSKSKIKTLSQEKISKIAPVLYEETSLDVKKKARVWVQESLKWSDAPLKDKKSYIALVRKTVRKLVDKLGELQ